MTGDTRPGLQASRAGFLLDAASHLPTSCRHRKLGSGARCIRPFWPKRKKKEGKNCMHLLDCGRCCRPSLCPAPATTMLCQWEICRWLKDWGQGPGEPSAVCLSWAPPSFSLSTPQPSLFLSSSLCSPGRHLVHCQLALCHSSSPFFALPPFATTWGATSPRPD